MRSKKHYLKKVKDWLKSGHDGQRKVRRTNYES